MKPKILALTLGLALAGCAPAAGIGGTAVVAPVVASALGVSTTTLSEVAAGACATQAAANAAAQGSTTWAS